MPYAFGIGICWCSLFFKREPWASKSTGANSTLLKASKSMGAKVDVPKIYGFVLRAPAASMITHFLMILGVLFNKV